MMRLAPTGGSAYPGSVYFEIASKFSCAARLQLWSKADVSVNSAIREAVNIWPLEYIVGRQLVSPSRVEPAISC